MTNTKDQMKKVKSQTSTLSMWRNKLLLKRRQPWKCQKYLRWRWIWTRKELHTTRAASETWKCSVTSCNSCVRLWYLNSLTKLILWRFSRTEFMLLRQKSKSQSTIWWLLAQFILTKRSRLSNVLWISHFTAKKYTLERKISVWKFSTCQVSP